MRTATPGRGLSFVLLLLVIAHLSLLSVSLLDPPVWQYAPTLGIDPSTELSLVEPVYTGSHLFPGSRSGQFMTSYDDSKVFMFGGYTDEYKGDLWSLSLEPYNGTSYLTKTYRSRWEFINTKRSGDPTLQHGLNFYGVDGPSDSFPGARQQHALHKLHESSRLRLYGGTGYPIESPSPTGLSDMWDFNVESRIWTYIETVGGSPHGEYEPIVWVVQRDFFVLEPDPFRPAEHKFWIFSDNDTSWHTGTSATLDNVATNRFGATWTVGNSLDSALLFYYIGWLPFLLYYDLATGVWSDDYALKTGSSNAGPQQWAIVYSVSPDGLYSPYSSETVVYGGTGETTAFFVHLDPVQKTQDWTPFAFQPGPRHYSSGARIGSTLILYGGAPSRQADTWTLEMVPLTCLDGKNNSDPLVCAAHGRCSVGFGSCECDPDYFGNETGCGVFYCLDGIMSNSSDACSGSGSCPAPNEPCACDAGFNGPSCQYRDDAPSDSTDDGPFADAEVASVVIGVVLSLVFCVVLAGVVGLILFLGRPKRVVSMEMAELDDRSIYMLNPKCVTVDRGNKLGDGSQGRVYKGLVHVGLQSLPIAAKRTYVSQTREIAEREVSILVGIDSDHLIRTYGCFYDPEDEDVLVIVMEFCHDTIDRWISENVPSPEKRLVLVTQVAEGVAHLHAEGIVHRDLKPANILIDESGSVRITDFGFSKKREEMGDTILGTPGFMAPELFSRERDGSDQLKTKIDVFAFGVLAQTLWELPTPDGETSPLMGERLLPLLKECQAPLPEDRPSMSDVVSRLRQILDIPPESKS